MIKCCKHCGGVFHVPAADHWRVYCSKDCWLESKIAERTRPLLEEIDYLERENARLRRLAETALPRDVLRSLRVLCHPDKHGGSALATKLTQWLNNALTH